MQLVCKRRHTAFVVANGGGKLLRKSDDLRYANALPELFVEGGQQPNHGGSLHIGKGILNPFLREDMLHTPVVISSVGTGKRQCILRKLYHMQNTALGRTKQLGSQIVLFDCRDDLLQGNTCLCFSVLSDYARVLRSWKVQYAPQSPAEAPDERFEEACHKLDEAEYYLDILAFGDSYERAEVVSYLLADGRLDKLKEKINGRDAA